MNSISKSLRTATAAALIVAALVGCSSKGDDSASIVSDAADTGLQPSSNGFAFANFGARASSEVFNTDDLITMFGSAACVDGIQNPCDPTTQAAAWARMVNEARASGHCEGLAVQAAARFDSASTPATNELLNAGDVTHGIMRAFATQFLPEVQDATNKWADKSLVDIVNELVTTMKTGKVEYSLGLYTPTGGHAVLPYAVQFPSKNLVVIKVYDSNWPGQERYVVFDLAAKKWFFSFNGKDPQKDECAWTGGAGDIDITPMAARTSATCPFCGNKATVTKSVLLIRSTGVEWKVKTKNGTFSPANSAAVEGTNSRSLRSASCGKVVSLPEFILTTDSPDFELTLPETASAYISNGKSVIQIQTNGKKKRKPIIFTDTSVQSDDAGTTVTLAANNLATQVTADTSVINFDANKIVVDATIGNETKTVTADTSTPQVIVTTDTGKVVTTTDNVDLKKVEAVIAPDLTPSPTKGELPPAEEREAQGLLVTTTTVPATTTTVVNATPTTTLKKLTTTTTKSTAPNATTSTTSTTAAPATTATTAAPATTATTAAATTTTVAATKTLTIFGYTGVGGTPSGTITMNPSIGSTRTCSSLMSDCTGTFQVGASVAITVAVTSTGNYIVWTPDDWATASAPAAAASCPRVAASGPQPAGAEVLPTTPGSLLCTYTMTSSNTRFSFWVS